MEIASVQTFSFCRGSVRAQRRAGCGSVARGRRGHDLIAALPLVEVLILVLHTGCPDIRTHRLRSRSELYRLAQHALENVHRWPECVIGGGGSQL